MAEILDFQKTFAETRAQTKAVDLELRRLDAEEARSHVRYLLAFMPPQFLARGGDHDAILTLLLIPRMTRKTEILITQVRDKYQAIDKIDRYIIHRRETLAIKKKFTHFLLNVFSERRLLRDTPWRSTASDLDCVPTCTLSRPHWVVLTLL